MRLTDIMLFGNAVNGGGEAKDRLWLHTEMTTSEMKARPVVPLEEGCYLYKFFDETPSVDKIKDCFVCISFQHSAVLAVDYSGIELANANIQETGKSWGVALITNENNELALILCVNEEDVESLGVPEAGVYINEVAFQGFSNPSVYFIGR